MRPGSRRVLRPGQRPPPATRPTHLCPPHRRFSPASLAGVAGRPGYSAKAPGAGDRHIARKQVRRQPMCPAPREFRVAARRQSAHYRATSPRPQGLLPARRCTRGRRPPATTPPQAQPCGRLRFLTTASLPDRYAARQDSRQRAVAGVGLGPGASSWIGFAWLRKACRDEPDIGAQSSNGVFLRRIGR